MAIILTVLIFVVLGWLWRSAQLIVRLLVAAAVARILLWCYPAETLALLPGVATLALMAGAFIVMVGGWRRS